MTTRWFLDTEFNDGGRAIELISIALVSEHTEYYAIAKDGWNPHACNPWVQENVLPKLAKKESPDWRSRADIAAHIKLLLSRDKPEIWGNFSDYDWVAFCQIFGRMVDLPTGFPKYCLDLKQTMRSYGIGWDDLPVDLKLNSHEHHALVDARWNRKLYLYLQSLKP